MSLLVFDPATRGSTLKKKLQEDTNWEMLVKRGVNTLQKEKQYQITYISPGIMNTSEREASKVIRPAS